MRVIETVAGMQEERRRMLGSIGLAPTMGALHEGHLTLCRQARTGNEVAGASLFVNPTQFGPNEDFNAYPRDYQRDLDLFEKERLDFVFMPTVDEMYPKGFDTYVHLGDITKRLEGASRPDHFVGVATVVAKLFLVTRPTRAYFGEKDAQQLRVIQQMVRDLCFDLEVIPVPTVREPDGLAMSSRNAYLTPEQRAAAPVLYRALNQAKKMYQTGERDANRLRTAMQEMIGAEPLADIDYISVSDSRTLVELEQIDGPALGSMAVRFGRTRLIDNITLS
jgi:pantoate--beta-alanine ligase